MVNFLTRDLKRRAALYIWLLLNPKKVRDEQGLCRLIDGRQDLGFSMLQFGFPDRVIHFDPQDSFDDTEYLGVFRDEGTHRTFPFRNCKGFVDSAIENLISFSNRPQYV